MSSPYPASRHRRRLTGSHNDKPPVGICRTYHPTFGAHRGACAPSSGDLFWTGTLFLPSERSQPGTPDGACHDALQSVTNACAAGNLADPFGEALISDEPASDAGTDRLVGLLGKLHVSSEPAMDQESVGSTDPMPVDSDTAS